MLSSKAWDILDNYMVEAIKGCINDLKSKKFNDMAEVARIQGKIEAFESIYGTIKDKLRKGNK